jgi:hypothetical protein
MASRTAFQSLRAVARCSAALAAGGVLAMAASCSGKTGSDAGDASDGDAAPGVGACASASAADRTFDPSLHDRSCSVAADCMLATALGPIDSAGNCETVCCKFEAIRATDVVRADIARARTSCCTTRVCGAACFPGPIACVDGQCVVTKAAQDSGADADGG